MLANCYYWQRHNIGRQRMPDMTLQTLHLGLCSRVRQMAEACTHAEHACKAPHQQGTPDRRSALLWRANAHQAPPACPSSLSPRQARRFAGQSRDGLGAHNLGPACQPRQAEPDMRNPDKKTRTAAARPAENP